MEKFTNRQKRECIDIISDMMRDHPEAVILFYRHTDGTIRLFRYSDMEYVGISKRNFPHAPPITPELERKVEGEKTKVLHGT